MVQEDVGGSSSALVPPASRFLHLRGVQHDAADSAFLWGFFHLLCDLSVSKGSDGMCLGESIHARKAYINAAPKPSV